MHLLGLLFEEEEEKKMVIPLALSVIVFSQHSHVDTIVLVVASFDERTASNGQFLSKLSKKKFVVYFNLAMVWPTRAIKTEYSRKVGLELLRQLSKTHAHTERNRHMRHCACQIFRQIFYRNKVPNESGQIKWRYCMTGCNNMIFCVNNVARCLNWIP